MKDKVFLIPLIVLLVTGLDVGGMTCQYIPPPPPYGTADTIVLAASVSETGPLADVHNLAKKPIVNRWLAENPTMTVGNSMYPVEIEYLDDGSFLSKMVDNTDSIIDGIHDGTYHILLGPTCTAFLECQAVKATTGKVVQMGMEGGATSLFPFLSAYPYSFFNLSFSNWFQIPVLAKLLKEAHTAYNASDPCTAYIGYQHDDHGLEYLGEATKYFGKEGITTDGSYAMTSGDPGANAALISAAKAAGSDILCVFAYPEFVFTTHAEAKAQGYNPKAMILGPGGNFGTYGATIAGNASEGVMCFAVANNKTTKGTVGQLMSDLENDPAIGLACTDYWGDPCYWAALQMLQESVEAVGSDNDGAGFTIDQSELKEFLATTKLNSSFGQTWYVTPDHALGPTEYSWDDEDLQWPVPDGYAALLNYKCHTGEIGQWQSGYIEIVGYAGIGTGSDEYELTNYDVTANFTYPMTDLWGWLS